MRTLLLLVTVFSGLRIALGHLFESWSPFSRSSHSSLPAQPSSSGVAKYNYSDDSGVTFLLQGNISIHLNYITDTGKKKSVTEAVPWHVDINQIYHNNTFPKVMETNLTWGPSQEFILQFILVSSMYLWNVADVTFYFTSEGPFDNVSAAVDRVSTSQDLFQSPVNHAYKCSSVDLGQLVGANLTTADIVIREFELQAFYLDDGNFSPDPLVCSKDAALSLVAPIVIGSVIGATVLLILTVYIVASIYKSMKERRKRRAYELLP